jgi:uncharacterized membrane protein SirB2
VKTPRRARHHRGDGLRHRQDHPEPSRGAWLLAKIIGLVAYIGLGMVALKPGRPPAQRALAWLAALAVFGYIVSVALTRNPLGFIALL